jgi:hypothetical protein
LHIIVPDDEPAHFMRCSVSDAGQANGAPGAPSQRMSGNEARAPMIKA